MALFPEAATNSLLGRLFLRKHFGIHRIFGLVYLIEWAAAFALYWHDYGRFERSFLVWALPLSGVAQTVIAIRTFTFLPKRDARQGYFTTRRVMSFDFIKENLFFAGILCFQWFYMTDRLRDNIIAPLVPLEYLFVFFPYQLRWLFPKTSFRHSSYELTDGKNANDLNKWFFYTASRVTKAFYVWAKHFIGFFLNYARFNGRITPEQQYHLHFLLIMSCFATTIAMFLQTLKFKGYMGAKTSFTTYFLSYMATFYSFLMIRSIFFDNFDLALLALGGLLLNFGPKRLQAPYQVFVALVCTWMRAGSPGLEGGIGGVDLSALVPQNVSSGVEGVGAHIMSMFVHVAESGSIHANL